jgi:hypothetical protein
LERGYIVQKRTVKIVLALLIVASLLLVLVPPAMSRGMDGHWHKGKGERMKNIDEIYETIAYTGSKDGAITFNILGVAVKDKSGNATVMTFPKPLAAQYFSSNGTFMVSRPNITEWKGHVRPIRTSYDNATIDPSGASCVLALKNFTLVQRGNKTVEFQFTGMSVYLPDGSVKSYTYSTPVKIVKSWKDKMTTISNPAVVADVQDAVKGGGKFPAGSAPVPLKSIDAK